MHARFTFPALVASALALAGCDVLPPNPFLIAYVAMEGPCSLPGAELLPECGVRPLTTVPATPEPIEDDPEFPDGEWISLGFDSELLVDEGRLDFGSLEPGWTATAEVLLFNDGEEPVAGTIFLNRGDAGFTLEEPELPFRLEPGEELVFELSFAPPAAGEYGDRLRVEDEDGLPLTELAVTGRSDGMEEN